MKIFRKKILSNGRRRIYLFGMKIATFKGPRHSVFTKGVNNKVDVNSKNIKSVCNIYGNNNVVNIEESLRGGNVNIFIRGNNNKIHIKPSSELHDLNISIGNFVEINDSEIFIDAKVCIVGVEILIEQHKCKLHIGKRCLISKEVLFRLGEVPHLVFDSKTKEYVDTPAELVVGDHVWIGKGVVLLKKTKIGDNCIVGTNAVVTKEFGENNVLLAGNPASIKRKNVYWVGSDSEFTKDEQEYKNKYYEYLREINKRG
ncbi:MAG: hypothetical protein J6W27_02085 [Alphaproteobacteria bacterium]|nr:hypothetical protein [Alphaproteobacteria bacterium]